MENMEDNKCQKWTWLSSNFSVRILKPFPPELITLNMKPEIKCDTKCFP